MQENDLKAGLLRKGLVLYLVLLAPIAWLMMRFSPYALDGDAVAYMDIGGLILHHRWAGVVNGYWHPLYPAVLALTRAVFHPTRWNELGVAYIANFFIFAAEVAAMLAFVTALDRLRTRMATRATPLLSLDGLRLLGIALVVIATQRELGMDKVRPDALLQALLLAAFAMLLFTLADESLVYPALMGLFLGLAYLTKSFAFVVALLSLSLLLVFAGWLQKRALGGVVLRVALAAMVFAAVAGPYMAALSHQKHRLDFGDSGALNYAWYSGGTEKLHLEPGQPERYGSATVHLVHPDQPLLASPGIFSYKAEPYGTYPDWFDPTFFNERVVPHLNPHELLHRDLRNVALVIRYLFNHPEALVLLSLLLSLGARFRFGSWKRDGFWLPMIVLGTAMWLIYGLVNIEERYVTLAYLVMLLPLFAALSAQTQSTDDRGGTAWLPGIAAGMVLLLAFLGLGESLRTALENRRMSAGLPHPWYSPQIYGAAEGLQALGVRPGDQVACMGTIACVHDNYWARLAGVRILTEVYNSDADHLFSQWSALNNRAQVDAILKIQGAKVLVAHFDPAEMVAASAAGSTAAGGWRRLGQTDYYALPLDLVPPPVPAALPAVWAMKNLGP